MSLFSVWHSADSCFVGLYGKS